MLLGSPGTAGRGLSLPRVVFSFSISPRGIHSGELGVPGRFLFAGEAEDLTERRLTMLLMVLGIFMMRDVGVVGAGGEVGSLA